MPIADGPKLRLEWYRDATKWMMAVAGGTIVLGAGWIIDERPGTLTIAVYSASALILLISSFFSVLAMFKYADFAKEGDEIKHATANKWAKRAFWLFLPGLLLFIAVGAGLIWGVGVGTGPGEGVLKVVEINDVPGLSGVIIDQKRQKILLLLEGPGGSIHIETLSRAPL